MQLTSKPTTRLRRLLVFWIDRHLNLVAVAPYFANPPLENAESAFLLSGFNLSGDGRRNAVPRDVPAGTVIAGKLPLIRDGEVPPDALREWSKLVHDQGRIHPVRPEPGAVLFH